MREITQVQAKVIGRMTLFSTCVEDKCGWKITQIAFSQQYILPTKIKHLMNWSLKISQQAFVVFEFGNTVSIESLWPIINHGVINTQILRRSESWFYELS